ncbi:putative pantoate--beta-alanine ligase (AMP-forming) [Helianthus annuus]|uniref:Pantoate--beta-alanine ligase n=1 Tax=Helianthus annuus TaxID=4232 RepID=A0A251RZU7_HELAN|nr:putative pantoate--beta-alanine ligase (AMP-forming) [Helianthus annuus]KAJ0438327.1 putative pantoate--beta-alanine ligase (AMP-forming) [Helianthus annuus]KAJ0460652.1 putative pantoate--beta-alanine ligase (AMP-forming) [Helianthus annuus]KAJ0821416.1 putative pantoate--beta-alanine ligase (AMP-forming) [Helianthus annuus]
MGYLHQGHLSLITEAQKHTHLTVVSIYINPNQFTINGDLSTYPSDFQGDINKLKSLPNEVDVVFNPQNIVCCLEGGGHETWVRVEKLEKGMCGKSRPVFFRGVTIVVAKLFNIVEPDVAVFGKKEYQQWRV